MVDVIEVLTSGPQGIQGEQGEVGVSSNILVSEGFATQVIPIHDGSNEVVLDLGISDDAFIDVSNSTVTILQTIAGGITGTAEIHSSATGTKICLVTVWWEFSTDSGSTWMPLPNSLRIQGTALESTGVHSYDLAEENTLTAGTLFRAVCTNTGEMNSNLTIKSPPNIVGANGTATGRTIKLSVSY